MAQQQATSSLPARATVVPEPDRTSTVVSSLIIALLLATTSIAGLLYPATLYPSEALRHAFLPNDIVNLVIGLPLLLASMWLAGRGRPLGLLFWPGALFFIFYNALIYTVALPVNAAFVLNLLLLALSAYTMIALIATIDAQAIRQRLAGHVPERLAGGVLMSLGILFILFVIGALADALLNQAPVSAPDRALHVADLMLAPSWVIGGLLLWRRRSLGYVAGAGLLFQASMLFVGLIAVLLLDPLLNSTPLRVGDIVALALMGLVSFVPFGLFLRGIQTMQGLELR